MQSELPECYSPSPEVQEFFALARERYSIKLLRDAGHERPWTDDPILQQFRFCNVHREHDRTTRWFRENIRDPLRDNPLKVVMATIGFRWFNRIETGELIKDILLEEGWNGSRVHARLENVSPLVTGAYMIKTPAKMNKLRGIINCMDGTKVVAKRLVKAAAYGATLKTGHQILTEAPYLGGFMAYEVISDLRWTCLFHDALDIMTWCHLGPGATRGINLVTNNDYNRTSKIDQLSMLKICHSLLRLSQHDEFWPQEWTPWEMREVEHFLCEFDKWKRGCGGQRLKRRYQ